jgi:hypothetical protein
MTAVRLKAQQLNRVRKAAGIGHMPYPGRFRSLLAAARRAPWGPSAPLGRFGRPTFSARLAPKSALPSAPNGLVVLIYPMGPEGVGALRMGLLTSDFAGSLKIKRNELLWIAGRLGPEASEGIDIDGLQRIATERPAFKGLPQRRKEWSTSDDRGCDFLVGGVNRPLGCSARSTSTSM